MSLNVRYAHRRIGEGRVTIAFVEAGTEIGFDEDITWIGASWMSPKERNWDRKKGNQIALGRALSLRNPDHRALGADRTGLGGRICLGVVPDGKQRAERALERLVASNRVPGWVVPLLKRHKAISVERAVGTIEGIRVQVDLRLASLEVRDELLFAEPIIVDAVSP